MQAVGTDVCDICRREYRADPRSHKDFSHALLHIGKANGKLLGLCDDLDHGQEFAPADYEKLVADLLFCTLRIANTWPGGKLDLQEVAARRARSKGMLPDAGDATEGQE